MLGAPLRAQEVRTVWRVSNHTMGDALLAGFTVVDTFYTLKDQLVFVLQRQSEVLMCEYSEQQTELCTELGRD